MTWPTSDVSTVEMDAGTDSPATARADIKSLADGFNQIRNHVSAFVQGILAAADAAAARAGLGLGTAATKNTGTLAGNVVELATGGKLPAVDGSQLTGLPSPSFAGHVVQVVHVVKSSTYSVSAAADTWYDVTDASASITPRNTASKILVMVNGLFDAPGTLAAMGRILRGSTPIGLGDAAGSRVPTGFSMNHYNKPGFSMSGEHCLDSPATDSLVTYKVQVRCGGASGGTIYVGHGSTDADTNQHPRVPLTITLWEIAA